MDSMRRILHHAISSTIQNDILIADTFIGMAFQMFLQRNLAHCHNEGRLYKASSKISVICFQTIVISRSSFLRENIHRTVIYRN